MTKLLGTIVSFFLLTQTMAQQTNQLLPQKNALKTLTDSIRNLPPLEVRSVRVSENSPFAKTNVDKASISQVNFGQDLPFLIQNTPSVVVNADAGNGIGYTGIRIRGTDATRINVTLNGIPYNDAESMGTYFVDLPDFSSSANSIQIQRGVGTSTNGAGAFGATLNLATNDYRPAKYLNFQNTIGSFHSFKNNIQFGTGLMNNHFTIDGRFSNIKSDGYIDRAKSNLKSFYISSTYWGDQSSLRLNVFSGIEKTYQAWYGVPEDSLQTHRSYNPAGTEKMDAPYSNQTDNYTQTHYQLFYNKEVNSFLKWSTAFFLTTGRGYYEEYKGGANLNDYNISNYGDAPIDIVRRRWLDNQFYGQIASLTYEQEKNIFTLGGGWNIYDGKHFGNLPYAIKGIYEANHEYYHNPATKKELNTYAKWERKLNNQVTSFIDLQFRQVQHTINGFQSNPSLLVDRKFQFFNPKAGISYKNKNTTYYTSIAVAHKEPNRDDFEAGTTQQPKQESLYDWETGLNTKMGNWNYGVNVYYMNYKDQLVLTGKINDIGAYTRTNVDKSYRAGIEIEGAWKINAHFSTNGNITFSKNKIAHFTEYYDDYDNGGQVEIQHHNTDITLSPNLTASHQFTYKVNDQWQFILSSKYVSKQYLDNTQNESRTLKAFFVNDINVSYQWNYKKGFNALVQFYALNVLDVKYEPNGYTYSYLYGGTTTTSNNYFPMAGRNYMLSLKIDIK